MSIEMNIQWFPGHMTKARRMMEEQVRLVDAVCEIVDARIPESSRNPDVDEMVGAKPRVLILNRIDQADPALTKAWAAHYKALGYAVIETDSRSGKGVNAFYPALRELLKDKLEQYRAKGLVSKPLRAMIVGIPNVGKSSFINRVAKRKAAQASDKPGVTRGKQWIAVGEGLELLDTPGILWPRFDNQTVGENLAFTGAVRDEIMDRETLAANLLLRLRAEYPERIEARYKFVPDLEADGYTLLETAARKRGFLISGGEVDLERMAAVLLDEFRGGKLGRVTLEVPSGVMQN
ncbi:MAG: ribosome biogenesis GTPase YlqF [Oscillospiraceae bacterium]|nr:ribosome biogenesis GTPase YlqF [Oscillospiraceae bacterium]